MSRFTRRPGASRAARTIALTGVTVVACAASASPALAAKAKPTKYDKTQNSAIKKVRTSASKAGTAAKKAQSSATAAGKSATQGVADAKRANDGLSAINAGVPAIIDGLTQLKDGLTAAGAGLTALKTGLTQAAAGLTSLQTLATSTEYGFFQLASGSTAPYTLVPGCFYESSDIPDSAQDAIVSGTCLLPSGLAAGTPLHLLTGIRSYESDGVAASGSSPAVAAGNAGIVAYTQTATGCATTPCALLQGGGATSPTSATTPPAVDVPLKSPPTADPTGPDAGFPFSIISTDKTIDLFTTQFTGTPAAPLVAAAGNVVTLTVRFTDLTASATDPSA